MRFRISGAAARAAAVALLILAFAAPAWAITKTWTNNNGAGDGRWLTASNWSPAGVPTAADDVEIGVTDQASNYCVIDGAATANSVTVGNSFTNNPTLEVKFGATLTIAAASSVVSGATLYFNNGNLAGAGALTNSGTINFAGGTLGGSGALTLNAGAFLNFTSIATSSYLSRSVTNNGTITYGSTTNFYYFLTTAIVTNNGTIDIQADEDIWTSGAGPFRIDNQSGGVVRKSAGAGMGSIKFAVNNATGGFVKGLSGTLLLEGGGTSTGQFETTAGTTIGVSATNYNLNSGATVTGAGKIAVGGTLTIGAGADVTVPSMQLINGSSRIEGTGTLRIGTHLQWDGGYMTGGGLTIIQGTATAAIACTTNYCYIDNRQINLGTGSTTTYTAPSFSLWFYNGGSLNVNTGAVFDIQTDQDIFNGGGVAPSMSNAGTIQKTSGSGATALGVPLTSTGAITVTSGDLQFSVATTINGGTVSIGTTSNFDITGNIFSVAGAFTVSGTGNFRVTGGAMRIASGVTQVIPRLTLNGTSAIIDGAGTLQLSGTNTWGAGFMGSLIAGASGGITEVLAGATLNITGVSYAYVDGGRQLLNNGTINYSSPSWGLYLYNGGDVVNNGVFDMQTDQGISISGAGALVTNNGQFLKSGGTGTTGAPMNAEFDNTATGTVSVTSGRLNLAAGGTSSGAFSIGSGAFIQITAGVYDFAGTPGVTGLGVLRVVGGNMVVPTGVTLAVPSLQFDSGYISGAGTLQLTGASTWTGGTMGHTTFSGGTTQVTATGTLDIASTTYVYLDQGRGLVNNNVINYTSATFGLWIYNGSSLTNAGTFNYDSDIGIGTSGTGTLITNSGTILKDSGTGAAIIAVPLNNTGLIQVDSGTLLLGANGTHTTGAFTGNNSGAAGFSAGTHTLDATSTFGGSGTIMVTGGNVTMAGSYDPVKLTVSGGTLNLNSNGTAGILTFSNSGIIGGSGTLTILADSTWTGGQFEGTGTTIIDAGTTLTISATSSYCYIAGSRTVTNNGTVAYTATTTNWHLYLHQSGVFNNAGTFNITSDQVLYGIASTVFNNSGTLNKSGGTGTNTVGVVLHNTGSVNVTTGGLSFANNGTHTGSFTATAPGLVGFSGGTHTMSAPGTFSGTGTLAFTGATVTSAIPYTVGTLKVTLGTATMNATGSADTLDMSGGALGGTGTLTLNTGGTWSGGTMAGTGSTILPAGQTLAINASGAYPTLDTRTFTSSGTVNYTNTTTYLQVYNNATFVNNNVFNHSGDQGIYGFNNGTFSNPGTFNRIAGTGNAVIAPIFNNTGTLNVNTGTLSLSGNGTHTGSFAVASGATLAFSGGSQTATAGSITGSGTLAFTGGATTLSIPYTVGGLTVSGGTATLDGNGSAGAFTMSNGVMNGSGTFTATNGGTWSGGTMAGTGNTIIPATKTLNITAATNYCTVETRTLTNNGIINYAPTGAPYLQVYTNGTINNTGAMNLTAGTYIYGTSGGAINNSGTVTKTGTTQLDFWPILNNTGQVTVTGGTLSLNGGGTHTNGLFTSTSPAFIQFGGGTHNLAGTGSMNGTGGWSVTSGTVNVGVPYSLVSLAMSNGRIDFNTSGSIGTLGMSYGTIGGTGTVSVSENSTWTGGFMDGTGSTIFAAGKTVTVGGANYLYIDARTVQNNGTMNYVAPNYYLQIYNNGVLDITATGILNIQTDLMLYGYGGGTINNAGAINRTTGSGNINPVYPVVNNDGAVNVTTGGLAFLGGGAHGGTFNATSPGILEFQSGTNTFSAASTLGGTGRFRFTGGSSTVNGTWGVPIDITNGTLVLNTNGSASSLNMTGSGALGGTGNVTVTGDSTLGGGTLTGTGTLTYDTGVVVSMPGNYYVTVERPVLNKGTFNYTPPIYYLQINGATFTNDGIFDIQTDQIVYAYGTSPLFQNNGTLKRTAGTGSLQFYAPFSNDGVAQFGSGTTYFSSTYVQGSGITELLNGATLQTTLLDLNGGSLIGTGTVQGNVTSDAIVAPGTSAGALTITGNYIQNATGALNIELGGTTPATQYDRLVVQGAVTLDGDLNVSTINGFLPASGNTFQVLTFASRNPAGTDFANKNGLNLGSGTNLIPAYSATDLQLTTNTVQADLQLSMTASPATVSNGGSFAYNLSVFNAGGSAASGVAISAPLPANVTFVNSVPAICTGAPLVCTVGNLADQGTAAVTINVQANGSGTATLNASVAASQFDPNNANNAAAATVTIAANADLSVTVTDTVDPVAAGSSVGYTIVVTNNGPDAASGVSVTATPSAALTFNSAGAPCAGGFPCSLGNLASGATVTITTSWSVAPTATGTASLGVGVSATSPADPDSSDNTASQSTTIGQDADVQVVKTGPANVPPESGSTVTYSIVVTNNGPSNATAVSLDDPTPSGLTLQSVTGDCSAFPCAIGTMTVGQTKTVQVTYQISGAVGTTFTNTATVTSAGDTNSANDSSSVVTTISSCPNVTIGAPPSVNGNSTGNVATVTAVTGATYSWSIGNGVITAGANTNSITFTAGAGGNVTLNVTVTSGACTATPTATVPIISADLSVTKTGPANVAPTSGSTVTYGITVANNGTIAANSVVLTDPTPANLTFVSATAPCAGGFPCSLGTLNASASTSVQVVYSFTGGAQKVVTNTASVSSTTADSNGANNSSSVTTTIAACPTITISGPTAMEPGATETATASVVAGATYNWSITNGTINTGAGTNSITFTAGTIGTTTLSLTVTAGACSGNATFNVPVTSTRADVHVSKSGPASVASGAQFVYTLSIGNNGPASADNVSVSDTLPSGLAFVSVDSPFCTGDATITCNFGILPAGATQTVNITVDAPAGPLSLTNTAQVTTSSADPVTANNTSTVTTSVNGPVAQCPASAPSLLAPANGAANVASPVTFSWSSVANVANYELWTGPTAATLTLSGTTAGTSLSLNLASGSHAWKVIAYGGQSCNPQPSLVRTFTIPAPSPCPAAAPSLGAPASGATLNNASVTFSWSVVANATSYELWIGENGRALTLRGTTADTSLNVALNAGATYSWKVMAKGGPSCDPQPSATRTFTIAQVNNCAGNAAPTGLTPSNGQTVDSPVTFGWNSVANAIGYVVRMRVNGGALQDVGSTAGATTLTASVEPGAITFVVDALFASCPAVRSAEASFNVAQPAACEGSATPASPANGVNTTNAVVEFVWTGRAGASGYRLWLQTGNAAPEVLGETLGTSLTRTIAAGTHTWWVQTLFTGCPARESQHLTFTILPAQNCDGLGRPSPDSPASGITVSNPNVTFSWSAVPNAVQYELWLAPVGGVPTLLGTTGLTSMTAEVAPGVVEWFVKAIFNGCPATESGHRLLTYQPPASCVANERPVLIAPSEGERVASPVSFDWNDVAGATGYDLFVAHGDGQAELVASTTASNASGINRQLGAGRWFVRAKFAQPCAALDSTESRFVVVPPVAACSPLGAPVIAAPGQISSGVEARVQWSFVPGATAYVLQIANDPGFAAPTVVNTDAARRHILELENETGDPVAVYLRVQPQDSRCNPINIGPWSDVAIVYILPETGGDASALIGEPASVTYTLPLGDELAGQTFSATPTTSWLTVTPASGTVPAGGMNLTVVADTAGLPPGTNIGGVTITTGDAGRIRTTGTTVTMPFSVSLVSPVTPTPKSTPPPDALVIPAVANADGINSHFQSDVRVSNTSAQVMKYQLTFIPTGDAGISAGRQTTFSIEPGRTVALDDILKSWFGTGTTNAIGTLEVRPLTEVQKSTSSVPVSGLSNLVTFASSRTFNVTPNGTFGQYIPAIPFANFIGKAAGVLSLQQIAHSAQYRTNLGIVEGSGESANLLIKVFNSNGTRITEFPLTLKGGQHTQLNGFLSQHGVTTLNDGRVEVEVVGGNGKITAYASVLDNATADPLLVSPITLTDSGNTRWVMPGVADLDNGTANWQTDMRVFNAGSAAEELTLSFYSMNGGEAKTTTMTLQPGEVKQLDRILANTFGVTQNGGAVHVTSADDARLIATARTYNQTTQGTYGQFISAVTPSEAVGVGSRPLQLLQVEESSRYRSNIGLAEVSGKPVTLEVSIVPPDAKFTATVTVDLAANQFVQIPSMLAGLGLGEVYNARVTVRAIAGEGRATAYASVIDAKTNDPTYVPAQ